MAKSPVAILYSSDGNPVGVVLDGSVYRLQMSTKIARASDGAYVNPATQETLAAIKDTDGVKKIVDALPTGDNTIGRAKVTDGTNVLGVDAQNHIYVGGKSAPGLAPTAHPISISGVDDGGLKRALLTDNTGKLLVSASSVGSTQVEGRAADGATPVGNPVLVAGYDGTNVQTLLTDNMGNLRVLAAAVPSYAAQMINLSYRASDGAIVANNYKRVLTYTVPTGYSAYIIRFTTYQGEVAYSRMVMEKGMGTLSVPTNTYTAGLAYTAPQWAAVVEAEVTTQFGAANNVVVTVTYTNQSGVAGRTGTFSIPKSTIVGARFVLALQAGDIGVRAITNMSAAPSGGNGAIKVLGFIQLALHFDLSLTSGVYTDYSPAAVTVPEGTIIGVEYAGGTVAKDRYIGALLQLV